MWSLVLPVLVLSCAFALSPIPTGSWQPSDYRENGPVSIRRLEEMTKLREDLARYLDATDKTQDKLEVIQIDRYKYGELSLKDYYEKYALPGIPVVIEGYNFSTTPWTLERFKEKCGASMCDPKQSSAKGTGWGRLIDMGEMPLSEFIDKYALNYTKTEKDEEDSLSPPYVFDWGLPGKCPEIMDEFIVPKYFAQDFLQRIPSNSPHPIIGYRNSWPSLFIGSKGCQSSMHIDSFGSNFWMGQLEGKKFWRIFPWKLVDYLYEQPDFTFEIDPIKIDYERFPLLKRVKCWDTTIGPGDAIYIPCQSPHKVVSLTHTISISMNYVDLSNVNISREVLYEDTSEADNIHFANILKHPNFPAIMNFSQGDTPWSDFKHPPHHMSWHGDGFEEVSDDNITYLYELWESGDPALLWVYNGEPQDSLIEPAVWAFVENRLQAKPAKRQGWMPPDVSKNNITKLIRINNYNTPNTLLQHILPFEGSSALVKWQDHISIAKYYSLDSIKEDGISWLDIDKFWATRIPNSKEQISELEVHWEGWVFTVDSVKRGFNNTHVFNFYNTFASSIGISPLSTIADIPAPLDIEELQKAIIRVVYWNWKLYTALFLLLWMCVALARGIMRFIWKLLTSKKKNACQTNTKTAATKNSPANNGGSRRK